MNHSRNWMRGVKLIGPLLSVVLFTMGCATVNKSKPAYPTLESGQPGSVLKLDNTMSDSAWAMQMKAPIGLQVAVDGFSPAAQDKLKTGGKFGPKTFIPKGTTEIRLAPGSHTLRHQAKILGKSQYYFNPVDMSFDTDEGKTYVIRFKNTSTLFNLRYAVEYEGWSTEQTSQWPTEVRYANPIFGH